ALDTLNDVLYVVGPDGNLRRWNDRFSAVTGYDDDELSNMQAIDFVPEDEEDKVVEAIEETLSSGHIIFESELLTADDNRIPYEFTGSRFTDSEGNLIGIIGIGRDLTARKERERQLQQERDRLSALFEHLGEPVVEVTFDEDTAIIEEVNTEFEDVFEIDESNAVGESLDAQIVPGSERELAHELNRQVKEGDIAEREVQRQTASDLQWFSLRTVPFNINGERRAFAVYIDISDRKQREEELARQQSLLEAQQEAVIDGMLVVDEDGEIISYNDRYVEMWDIPEGIIAEEDDKKVIEWVMDQLVNPEDFLDKVKYLYRHPDETARDEIELQDGRVFDRYTTPLKGDEGTKYGRLWTFRDITERKQREQQLQRKTERLEKFASVVSHDLKNPLNVAEGYLELAQAECDSDHLDTIGDAHARMERLIEDVLTLAKEGEVVEEPKSVGLADLT
ncbi:MAG: PAS domain S-box protein, partial [Halobacteriaceae archaeon]